MSTGGPTKQSQDQSSEDPRAEFVLDALRPALDQGASVLLPRGGLREQLIMDIVDLFGSAPVTELTVPPANILFSAIRGDSLRSSEDGVRALYANLLGHAFMRDSAALVHPAFVSIIDQLSSLDVEAIPRLGGWILDIDVVDNERSSVDNAARNISFAYQTILSTPSFLELEVATDNLVRLGLFLIEGKHPSKHDEAFWIRKIPDLREPVARLTSDEVTYWYTIWTEGRITRTRFGDQFWSMVSRPPRMVRR